MSCFELTADALLNKTRAIFQKVPIIPAMKAAIAEKSGDKVWANVRPPLVELNDAQRAQLIRELDADGFGIPNATELADSTREAADAALAVA
jgi:4-hydroxy-tetrahydrodipicolinate synthase